MFYCLHIFCLKLPRRFSLRNTDILNEFSRSRPSTHGMVSDSFRIRTKRIFLEIFVLPTNHLYTVFILVCRHIYPFEFPGYRSAISYFRAAVWTNYFLLPQPKFPVFHPFVTKPAIMPRKPAFLLHFLINLLEPEFATRTFVRIVF